MTKKQLREAVREIVRRKLREQVTIQHGVDGEGNDKVIDAIAEIGVGTERPAGSTVSKGAKFAYFTDKTKQNVILVGYGQVSYSALKAKIVDDLNKMHQFAKNEQYDAVVSQWENVTKFVAAGLAELDQMLQEVDGVAPTAGGEETVQMTTDKSGKPMSQSDQNKINDLEAKKSAAQTLLEKTKGELAKKTKPYTDKINRLEKLIGDTNTAIERIKA
jgi:uncharacterized protein YnzC (UPF0291/DUF896 family)